MKHFHFLQSVSKKGVNLVIKSTSTSTKSRKIDFFSLGSGSVLFIKISKISQSTKKVNVSNTYLRIRNQKEKVSAL